MLTVVEIAFAPNVGIDVVVSAVAAVVADVGVVVVGVVVVGVVVIGVVVIGVVVVVAAAVIVLGGEKMAQSRKLGRPK